jgi:hypothetical protein
MALRPFLESGIYDRSSGMQPLVAAYREQLISLIRKASLVLAACFFDQSEKAPAGPALPSCDETFIFRLILEPGPAKAGCALQVSDGVELSVGPFLRSHVTFKIDQQRALRTVIEYDGVPRARRCDRHPFLAAEEYPLAVLRPDEAGGNIADPSHNDTVDHD